MGILCISGLWYAGRPVGLTLADTMSALWRPAAAALIAAGLCWYFVPIATIVHAHAARLSLFCACFGSVYLLFILLLGGEVKKAWTYVSYLRP